MLSYFMCLNVNVKSVWMLFDLFFDVFVVAFLFECIFFQFFSSRFTDKWFSFDCFFLFFFHVGESHGAHFQWHQATGCIKCIYTGSVCCASKCVVIVINRLFIVFKLNNYCDSRIYVCWLNGFLLVETKIGEKVE